MKKRRGLGKNPRLSYIIKAFRGDRNRVNPVFRGEKSCILTVKRDRKSQFLPEFRLAASPRFFTHTREKAFRADFALPPTLVNKKEESTFVGPSMFPGVPTGIRTRVTGVKGRCPWPLDDGDR
jgi:hypothetical protein